MVRTPPLDELRVSVRNLLCGRAGPSLPVFLQSDQRGLSPTGSGFQQASLLVFAGFVAILSSLKFLVQSASRREKEMPMRKAFVRGIRSVLETVWAVGASYTTRLLPG